MTRGFSPNVGSSNSHFTGKPVLCPAVIGVPRTSLGHRRSQRECILHQSSNLAPGEPPSIHYDPVGISATDLQEVAMFGKDGKLTESVVGLVALAKKC